LNTIDVAQNSSLLFASSRGRNNPESYLLVGPEYGKVFVVDANRFTLMGWVWGRNQPTGLSVSPDRRLVAFTDFLSDNLELFAINKWEE
jgi:DNA-binding beta-propeller fold protein YncE